MKLLFDKLITSAILTATVFTAYSHTMMAQPIEIGQTLPEEAIAISGISGGSDNDQGCGYLSKEPNQVIKIQDNANYMRLSVEVEDPNADPTLFIIGDNTNTQFCAFQDQVTGDPPEISGLWLEDNYSIYVGDRNGGQYNFTLTIHLEDDFVQ